MVVGLSLKKYFRSASISAHPHKNIDQFPSIAPFPDVTAVFNFDPADDAESHVHRIGRTGRAGKKGLAFTLMEPADERYCLRFVVLSMKKCGQAIPEEVARRQR